MKLALIFRKKSATMLKRGGNLLHRFSSALYTTPATSTQDILQQQINNRWFADRGDQTHRLDYDLNDESTVFDLGGYEGQWTSDIFSRFCCKIHVFEPVNLFAMQIKRRFSKNSKIIVHNFGLAPVTTKAQMSLAENGSSILRKATASEEIQLIKTADFIAQEKITRIDLLKINIEGAEYDLLDDLIESSLLGRVSNIQVQFHNFFPTAPQRMQAIQSVLAKTHKLTWQYPFMWENWKLNSIR